MIWLSLRRDMEPAISTQRLPRPLCLLGRLRCLLALLPVLRLHTPGSHGYECPLLNHHTKRHTPSAAPLWRQHPLRSRIFSRQYAMIHAEAPPPTVGFRSSTPRSISMANATPSAGCFTKLAIAAIAVASAPNATERNGGEPGQRLGFWAGGWKSLNIPYTSQAAFESQLISKS